MSPAPVQLELEFELDPAPAALDRLLEELPDHVLARRDLLELELVLAGQLYRMPAN